MGRKKLIRFADNTTAENVLQQGKEMYDSIKGNWNRLYFKNNNPIVVELACGYGEYTIGLARQFPQQNFIGIDIKGERLAVGSKIAATDNLTNVAFLRINIHFLLDYFESGEISEIWITFPDPFGSRASPARRLTHSKYLKMYDGILAPGGKIYLKTDSELMFESSLNSFVGYGISQLFATDNYYSSPLFDPSKNFETRFEQIFSERGYSIKFIGCSLKR